MSDEILLPDSEMSRDSLTGDCLELIRVFVTLSDAVKRQAVIDLAKTMTGRLQLETAAPEATGKPSSDQIAPEKVINLNGADT